LSEQAPRSDINGNATSAAIARRGTPSYGNLSGFEIAQVDTTASWS
jgi:hypothetical protein